MFDLAVPHASSEQLIEVTLVPPTHQHSGSLLQKGSELDIIRTLRKFELLHKAS